MIDSSDSRKPLAETPAIEPLREARVLQARIRGLKSLLEIQKWQIDVLNDRLHAETPGAIAARRLLALKRSERS